MYRKKENFGAVHCVIEIESLKRCDISQGISFRKFSFVAMKESLRKCDVSHGKTN
jgi:hypothetical protein